MVKVVYFPASVPLQRRWGTTAAVIIGTLGVFLVTWLLHSYQWFWLRGDFPLSANDVVFWGIFGACVLVNSLLETRSGRRRAGEATFGSALRRAARVVGMFAFLSLLWSYWSSPSLSDWLWTISAARGTQATTYAKLIVAAAVAVATIALAKLAATRITSGRGVTPARGGPAPRQPIVPPLVRPVGVGILVAALLLIVLPARRGVFGASAQHVAAAIGSNRLNAADRLRQDRGYYETLLDTRRSVADVAADPPREAVEAGVFLWIGRMRFVRKTDDLLSYELVPSYRGGLFRGLPFETNRWGMRDKDYSLAPPPGTYRIALLGASYEMGASVKVEQGFEWQLEERLNREGPGAPRRHYEILNFAVGGYSLPQNVVVAERKVFRFAPNALLIGVKTLDYARTVDILVAVLHDGGKIPYPELREMLRQAGVKPGMPDRELKRRIQSVLPDILQWSLDRIAQLARTHGVPAVALVVPKPDPDPADAQLQENLATWAKRAGVSVIRLEGVFDGHPLDSIRIPPPDDHPTALGQRLIADRLFEVFRQNDESLLKLGFAESRR